MDIKQILDLWSLLPDTGQVVVRAEHIHLVRGEIAQLALVESDKPQILSINNQEHDPGDEY